jgi:2,4-dienoyl-CoA reductase (NADPH2)
VVGAGPAGWPLRPPRRSAGTGDPVRGQQTELGGHFNLAMRIPGKEEFAETIRYYRASWSCTT